MVIGDLEVTVGVARWLEVTSVVRFDYRAGFAGPCIVGDRC